VNDDMMLLTEGQSPQQTELTLQLYSPSATPRVWDD